ncbi:uroporphyrinogen-III C-methyltransferase [Clostridium guangxiense]|uniref:uroporphyrinogen-III C-methyltransferase n=1 Tax=Clostridium guangxiense TaxID=1662055 RepID=UPI001E2A9C40|nr:uroporphyrinogen-III C-methyltransferase [Clostridium guangxiense]MCD2345681.1 uroporphyrinogen-III C-methyltransferase [Clostridium guangxiense]
MGKVYLIGAGPGDEELITLKAVRKLKECTAVLYDRLVGNNILNYVSEGCEVYYCGKEPGAHYKTQEEINKILVKLAKEGHIVGRVKGGDPYVFGRGGEEASELVKENIPFEVIPGITSAIAVLNYGGIPITQRGISQSFHVITGMSASGEKVNWQAVAKETGTLVFLMGLENLSKIVENLVYNGKNKSTPAAIIMRGTSSKQKKVVGILENIEVKSKRAELKSPCIIVVGEVVNFNESLNWYESQPLFGANICVTRSKKQASSIRYTLKDLGAEVTEINSIKFKSTTYNLKGYLSRLNHYNHIIFTSVNGVDFFFEYLKEQNYDIRNLKAKFSVVGKATSKALKEKGVMPLKVAEKFQAEGLFEIIKPILKPGEKVLMPSSSKARNYLAQEISKLSLEVDKVNIYETIVGEVKNTRAFDETDIVLFTSPSTVRNMIELVGIEKIKEKISIAIGPITLDVLKENNIGAVLCQEHSEKGLVEKIQEVWMNFAVRANK